MRVPPALLSSASQLEQGFAHGLSAMLQQHQGLGAYILVLANAAYDPDLWRQLSALLAERHHQLAEEVTGKLRHNLALEDPDDDVMVFLKLMAIGFAHLQPAQSRLAGHWQLSFNPIRALRPPRISGQRFSGLLRPFDSSGFHFNKVFLAKEILWQGTLNGKSARILYNKFPFARLHGLLVPEGEHNHPQFLSPELHGWAWEICAQANISGFCLAYNSTGAGASVNHLHFQSFVPPAPLPVQNTVFRHNGGDQSYPLPCFYFRNMQAAWLKIDELHQQNQPYNLIYSDQGLHLIPRTPQDNLKLAQQVRAYGWSELAGGFNLFNLHEYTETDARRLETTLASLGKN